jgi:hypothetical protein
MYIGTHTGDMAILISVCPSRSTTYSVSFKGGAYTTVLPIQYAYDAAKKRAMYMLSNLYTHFSFNNKQWSAPSATVKPVLFGL